MEPLAATTDTLPADGRDRAAPDPACGGRAFSFTCSASPVSRLIELPRNQLHLSPESTLALLEVTQSPEKIDFPEGGPIDIGEVEFAVNALPKKET